MESHWSYCWSSSAVLATKIERINNIINKHFYSSIINRYSNCKKTKNEYFFLYIKASTSAESINAVWAGFLLLSHWGCCMTENTKSASLTTNEWVKTMISNHLQNKPLMYVVKLITVRLSSCHSIFFHSDSSCQIKVNRIAVVMQLRWGR